MTHGIRIYRRVFVALAVSLMIVALNTGASAQGDGDQVTVAGMVVGILEDDEGNFQRVYVQDDSLGQVLVVGDEKGKELIGLIGSEVQATGMLQDIEPQPEMRFGMQITVSDYEVL